MTDELLDNKMVDLRDGPIAVQVEITQFCEYGKHPTVSQLARLVDEIRAWGGISDDHHIDLKEGHARVTFMVPAKTGAVPEAPHEEPVDASTTHFAKGDEVEWYDWPHADRKIGTVVGIDLDARNQDPWYCIQHRGTKQNVVVRGHVLRKRGER